jgi:CheY-like chemotaxis protein
LAARESNFPANSQTKELDVALQILLADDSMTAQNMGKKILNEAGYDVVTVSNGAAAVKKIAEVVPDLAILDVYMPGYNGLEVCERVKLTPQTSHVPVLLSVGKMEPFRPEDGMKVKADGVIIKPFEATDLVSVVEKLVARVAPSAEAASAETSAPEQEPAGAPASAPEAPTDLTAASPVPPPMTSAPIETAPALETFAPSDEPLAVPAEPHIEFTSVAATGHVDVVLPPEFQPTLISGDVPAEHAETDESLLSGYDFGTTVVDDKPAPEKASEVSDALSDEDLAFLLGGTHSDPVAVLQDLPAETVPHASEADSDSVSENAPQAATWHVEEEELTPDDLALDMEEVMRATAPQSAATPEMHQACGGAAGCESIDEKAQSADAPARSPETPMLAPLGKTSFDELDAIMEQAADRFAAQPPPAPAPTTPVENVLETEATSTSDVLDSEPLQGDIEPDLMSEDLIPEEVVVDNTPEAPRLHSSDSLSGVFELDLPAPPPLPQPPTVLDQEDILEQFTSADTEPAAAVESATSAEPIEFHIENESPAVFDKNAGLASHEVTRGPASAPDAVAPLPVETASVHEHEAVFYPETTFEAAEPEPPLAEDLGAESPAAETTSQPSYPTTEPDKGEFMPIDESPEAVRAVNAGIRVVPDEPPASAVENPAERVVDRVVERLRPMLAIMVEEIMRELKK